MARGDRRYIRRIDFKIFCDRCGRYRSFKTLYLDLFNHSLQLLIKLSCGHEVRILLGYASNQLALKVLREPELVEPARWV